jgi:hypothetical protein
METKIDNYIILNCKDNTRKMSETLSYVRDLHALVCKNDLKEILKLCEVLRQTKIHILGDIIKNHIEHLTDIQDIIIGYYNRPTTLKIMFAEHGFPAIKFKNKLVRFRNEDELIINSIHGYGDGFLDTKYDMMNIKVSLKDFYKVPKPICPYTSERMTHRQLAEIYYIRIIKSNGYSSEKIVEFIDNHCKYYHGSKHYYDYYKEEAEKENRTQTIPWFHEMVNKVYHMIKHKDGNHIRSTIEKELNTFHCKCIYNKIHNEGKVMTTDVFHALVALDNHIQTENGYFNLMISDDRLKKVKDSKEYHHFFSSESFEYESHSSYFEKAFELLLEIRKTLK